MDIVFLHVNKKKPEKVISITKMIVQTKEI